MTSLFLIFSILILATTRNPQLKGQFFNYAILTFALVKTNLFIKIFV
jgi:F0F1-type ATP synthase membrane subunit c/vacuolar-type H+-ATPase subunit K